VKGIIFTEFLEMVDQKFAPDVTERIIENAALPSGGAYTTIGSYDHTELVKLVVELSKESGVEVPELVRIYGFYLFERFVRTYPRFFSGMKDAFTFLEGLDSIVHQEVRKLYSDATPPRILCTRAGEGRMEVLYESDRCFADAAHGLLLGCIDYFGKEMDVAREDLEGGAGRKVRFLLTAKA